MKNQSSIFVGFLLILAGTVFLLLQFIPGLSLFLDMANLWPLIPLGLGIIFFLTGLISQPSLLIPGTILSGIGFILLFSNSFNLWEFWQLWLLVPAFVGTGIILSSLRSGGGLRRAFNHGGPPLVVGLVLFVVFTAVFSNYFSLLWPVLLIVVGLLWLLRTARFKKS